MTVLKTIWELPALLVWVPLLIVHNLSDFQVNIFSNNRDIRKCQSFCTMTTTTTTGLWQYLDIFFENSRAKNVPHASKYSNKSLCTMLDDCRHHSLREMELNARVNGILDVNFYKISPVWNIGQGKKKKVPYAMRTFQQETLHHDVWLWVW